MERQPYTKEWLEKACKESYSLREVLIKAGRAPQGGGSYSLLKKKIQEFNIDISHFTSKGWMKAPNRDERFPNAGSKEKYSLDEVFKKNSPVTQKILRGYVERHKLLEYKCEKCGCDGNWLDGKISLELHHKDGNNTNNEIKNLEYLCPNCHALTDNYCGKNKKKI